MNLNMFNEYKQKMMDLISRAAEYMEQHEKDDNFELNPKSWTVY